MRYLVMGLGSALALATGAGAAWEVGAVDPEGSNGYDSSVALEGEGRVHIVYSVTRPYSGLNYAYFEGKEWATEAVIKDDHSGYYNSLALDSDGRPHVSLGGEDLVYARRTESNWEIQKVVSGGEFTRFVSTSLALDGQDRPHISYFCEFYEPEEYGVKRVELKYAHWNGETWETSIVDPGGGDAWYKAASLALDGEGAPHICYQWSFGGRNDLYYAHPGESGWLKEVVDSDGDYLYPSLAIDRFGRPHISYFDEMGGNLKYARREEGRWIIETVDAPGWTGLSTAIALDAEGRPLISYYSRVPYFDEQSGKYIFKAARWTGEDWAISIIDSADCGFYDQAPWKTSIAAGPSGQPHISYYDFDSRGLKYATWRGPEPFPPEEQLPVEVKDSASPAAVNQWSADLKRFMSNKPYRFSTSSALYAQPDEEAEMYYDEPGSMEVEVVDGLSILTPYEYRGFEGLNYKTWLKVKTDEGSGWVLARGAPPHNFLTRFVTEGGWPASMLASFTERYAALREGPSTKKAVIKPEVDENEAWALKAEVPAGALYEVVARCGGWLCVGRRWNGGAWLPADAPALRLYHLVFGWDHDEWAECGFYFPVDDTVTEIYYSVWTYFKSGRIPYEDPVFTVATDGAGYELRPKHVPGYGGMECGQGFFKLELPVPVKRRDITSVTFVTGAPPRRFRVTVDPREAWAEYDEGR
jgi:hypothetical protein